MTLDTIKAETNLEGISPVSPFRKAFKQRNEERLASLTSKTGLAKIILSDTGELGAPLMAKRLKNELEALLENVEIELESKSQNNEGLRILVDAFDPVEEEIDLQHSANDLVLRLENLRFALPETFSRESITQIDSVLGLSERDKALALGCAYPSEINTQKLKGGLESKTFEKVVIIPRNLEDIEEIIEKLNEAEVPYTKFSEGGFQTTPEAQVLIIDNHGNASKIYHASGIKCAIIGGLDEDRTAHNPIEALSGKCHTIVGRNHPHHQKTVDFAQPTKKIDLVKSSDQAWDNVLHSGEIFAAPKDATFPEKAQKENYQIYKNIFQQIIDHLLEQSKSAPRAFTEENREQAKGALAA